MLIAATFIATGIAAAAAWRAAKLAERALADLERPHLFFEAEPMLAVQRQHGVDCAKVGFKVFNHGRFPADIMACQIDALTTYNPFTFAEGPNLDEFCLVLGAPEKVSGLEVFFPQELIPVRFSHVDENGVPSFAYPERVAVTTFLRMSAKYKGAGEHLFCSAFVCSWDHGPNRWVLRHKLRT